MVSTHSMMGACRALALCTLMRGAACSAEAARGVAVLRRGLPTSAHRARRHLLRAPPAWEAREAQEARGAVRGRRRRCYGSPGALLCKGD